MPEEKTIAPEAAVEKSSKAPASAAAPAADGADAPAAPVKKKKLKRAVKNGCVYITAGYNNTLLTATDADGNVLVRSSAGASGFKGTKKSTPYAAQVAAERLAELAQPYGLEKVKVYVRGIGPGREQGVRGLAKSFEIELIVDQTAVPHNGCRPKRRRRV